MKKSDCRMQSPPMRGERFRARRVWVALACAAVFVVAQLLQMKTAYAADDNWKSVWNHQSLDGQQQYIVGAYNHYDAAAYVCGYLSGYIDGLDLTIRGKLSSGNNAFKQLADSMQGVNGFNEDGLLPGLESYFGDDLWSRMQSVSPVVGGGGLGFDFNSDGVSLAAIKYWNENMPSTMTCYALNTNDSLIQSAKQYIASVLNGTDGGEGGFSGLVREGNYYVFSGNFRRAVMASNNMYRGLIGFDGNWVLNASNNIADVVMAQPLTVYVPTYYVDDMLTMLGMDDATGKFVYVVFSQGNTRQPRCKLSIYIYDYSSSSVTPIVSNNNYNGDTSEYVTGFSNNLRAGIPACTVIGVNATYSYDGSSATVSSIETNATPSVNSYANINVTGLNNGGSQQVVLGSGSSGGDSGPGDWPDPPVNPTPTPPEPPEPTPNPPEPDPPADPTPYTPPTFTPIGVATPTDTTDVIPWLRAILEQLKTIQSDMASHCQHIQDAISENADRIIETISSRVEWMADVLDGMFETLTDNICDTLRWLARQMQFDQTEPYNDTSLLYWIRKIYARLGNNPVNPVNPAEPGGGEQGFDFWAWLIGMLSNLIGGVLGDASDAVRTLLEGIRDKFPFSIPWDLMGILALLDAPRQTPDLTVTIPAINGWWEPIEFELDLAPYDDVASAVRAMVMIWWVAELIKRTNWMLDDVLGSVTTKLIGGPVGKLAGAV